jgi:hypothetical protein
VCYTCFHYFDMMSKKHEIRNRPSTSPHNYQSGSEVWPSGTTHAQFPQKINNDSVCSHWYILAFTSYQKSFLSRCYLSGTKKCKFLGTRPNVSTETAPETVLWYRLHREGYHNQVAATVVCNNSTLFTVVPLCRNWRRITPFIPQNTVNNNFLADCWDSLLYPAFSLDIVPSDFHFWVSEETCWRKSLLTWWWDDTQGICVGGNNESLCLLYGN